MTVIPDDVADIRRGIDHIGISVAFIVHDGKGNFLLQKRGQKARDEKGHWDVGGGAIEFGETIDEALRRELMEELCCEALEAQFLTAYDAHRQLDDGTKTHWIALHHMVLVDPATVRIGEPHKIDELGWFTSESLPDPLHSQFYKSFRVAKAAGLIN